MADDILERRKQLLHRRMREQGVQAAAEDRAMPARREGGRSPLSAAQQRMWFLQRLDPADTTLNICVAYRLDGALDPERLRGAFATVVARHEVLRNTYHADESGEPYQVSRADAELSWQQHDLTDLPDSVAQRRVEVLARREFARPFDLSADLPLRLTLIQTAPESHVLVLTIHHIGWDDDSWPVLFAELNAAYRGGPETLPTLRAQYVDVEVAGQADRDDAAGLEFWRSALTPLPERLELPSRRAGGAVSNSAATCVRALPSELLDLVAAVGREHAATPYMVLLAGFQALIHRYTAATDFLVSVPVTDRRDASAQALIGYFGNTLLVRADVQGADTFAALLDRTRHTAVDAFSKQGIGVDRVIQAVSPERVAGGDALAQLVQLSFSVRRVVHGFDLPGIVASELSLGSAVAREPLGLMVVQDDRGARVEATYLVDELEQALIAQLLDHYVQLLESALRDPSRRLRDLDLLGDTDRKTLLEASRGAAVDEAPTTMVALFERQVAIAPAHIAIASDTAELSYRALNERANRLAHWLIRRGIGSEDAIALPMATSVHFVVAILAVLKAGGAYLPIDPAYPADRIEYLLADAQPKLVLDEAAMAAAEQDASALPEHNPADADRARPLHPSNIAYIIYTSGSTGKPKGVPVPHDAIAEHLTGFTAEWALTSQDRVLQSTSVSFDASLLDIFVTLNAGARVVIPKPNAYRDIPYVADLITRHGITVLHMVPSMLATFLMLPEANDWRTLRHVPVGGEALPGEVADRFATQFDAELRNHYGPTEAVVSSTHMRVDGPQGTGIVPIGTPNRNVHLYLLDSALQLVPTGVAGEIYLGGNQLARGYLHRPGLTAARFVADPFRPGGRLYRTGDLARRNAAGEIEFIGRADEQVKVRGHRIELGEVEATVTDHPAVATCVVILHKHETLGPILAAYVVPVPGAEVELDQIRAHVAASLPEYMVPAAFSVIDEVPLTAHGKLDKRALPAPDRAEARTYREPQTPTEVRLAGLFGTLFRRDRVGADDSFFELGGHSLLAARLITMIRAEFGVELGIRAPFDHPRVSGLAQLLDRESGGESAARPAAELPPAPLTRAPVPVKQERPEHIPLSYPQRFLWFQERMEGLGDIGNITFVVRFDGPLDHGVLTAALGDVVARHAALRTTFPEQDGLAHQLVHPPAEVVLPVTATTAERLSEELAAAVRYRFTLDGEPLLRPQLFALDDRSHVLLLLAHHLIADHASLRVLLNDLVVAYRARAERGSAPAWAPLPLEYADFAVWQRDTFDLEAGGGSRPHRRELVDYWRNRLDGLPEEVVVARDRNRPQAPSRRGELGVFSLSAADRSALKAVAESCAASEFMLYQAAVAATLQVLGGGADIALGTPVEGRGPETADLVGMFANVTVVRVDLAGDPTVRAAVARARDNALEAYAHQDLPIELLVDALRPSRIRSRTPLYQTLLHFRGEDWTPEPLDLLGTGATTVTALPTDFNFSILDLNLIFAVREDAGLDVRVVVSSDLYDPETAQLITEAMAATLAAFASKPDARLSELEVLTADQVAALRERSPGTDAPVLPAVAVDGPVAETARTLIAILEELLEIDDVQLDDGFFALGGDSVISIQWAARANALGLPLTPQLVFEHFTIAELAAAVVAASEEVAAPDGSPVPQPEEQNYAPMSASGLDVAALDALTASWQGQS